MKPIIALDSGVLALATQRRGHAAGDACSSGVASCVRAGARLVVPGTDAVLLRAAELWAESRQRGLPTADPRDLDVDVILVAQILSLNLPSEDVVVATTNVGRLSRFLDARRWTDISALEEG